MKIFNLQTIHTKFIGERQENYWTKSLYCYCTNKRAWHATPLLHLHTATAYCLLHPTVLQPSAGRAYSPRFRLEKLVRTIERKIPPK
jgi:hypothetical protein